MFDFLFRRSEYKIPEPMPLWQTTNKVTEKTGAYTIGMTSDGLVSLTLSSDGVKMTMSMDEEDTRELIRKLTAALPA